MQSMTVTSTAFNEADIVRDTAGQFAGKPHSAPDLTLTADALSAAAADIPRATFVAHPTDPTVRLVIDRWADLVQVVRIGADGQVEGTYIRADDMDSDFARALDTAHWADGYDA